MQWFTTERGRTVGRVDGDEIGRVLDLVVAIDTGEHHPLVTRLLVGPRSAPHLIDHHDLHRFDDDAILVEHAARPVPVPRDHGTLELRDDELLLGRDVLDTQVIDIDGHRVARVADIAFHVREDGRLRVAGVDVGIGRVLDRLGLHRTGAHRGDRFIDWDDLHLASARGHDLQLAAPRSAVHRLDAADLAALLERLDVESGTEVLSAVPPATAAAAIVSGHHHTGERLLRSMPTDSASHIVRHMPEPHGEHWSTRLSRRRPLRGRRFHRTKGWRRHHRDAR